jgi:histone deacetylase 6
LIVAAGFDAAAGDVLGGCFVSPSCYAQMTHMLMTLSHGKLAVCLEGGYNFKSISKSALAVTKTLMGEPPDRLLDSSPTESAIATVHRVRSIQSQYWSRLYPKTATHPVYGDRLHGKNYGTLFRICLLIYYPDVIRLFQSNQLYEICKLTPLHIYRTSISKSFEKQVLAR